jgi:excisionase family DNA binding protein
MSFWEIIFDGKQRDKSKTQADGNTNQENFSPPTFFDEDILGTLKLGWYYSQNKNEFQMAKINQKDRATHLYVIGASGTGKTKFLEYLILQDIQNGNGVGVIDPHGDLIEDIKGMLTLQYDRDDTDIAKKVVLIDPTDNAFTVTFNPLEKLPGVSVSEQANELIGSFRKIWAEAWGVRMEDLMRNSLIALGEAEMSLAELPSFLSRRSFRKNILDKVEHPLTRDYFTRFDTLTDRTQITWIEPVMNKINAFLADERIRQMFSSTQGSFHVREVMDNKKMLLVRLDKGKLKDSADLLGSLLMAKIQIAAFSRSDIPQSKRVPFYLYIDEFQNFATESFAVILSEARKYGLSLIMAHQTLAQISNELRSLILGNTGMQVCFRVNRQDAQLLAKETFRYSDQGAHNRGQGGAWESYTEELQDLSPRYCYAKHKIEGGVIPLQTVEIEPAWEVAGMEEDEYAEVVKSYPFGQNYLISRKELATLSREKRAAVEKIVEEKTINGVKAPLSYPLPASVQPEKQAVKSSKSNEGAVKKSKKDEPSSDEIAFLKFVVEHPGKFVTKIYQALGLSGYKGDKLKESLIEKDLVAQEETREGRGGRLAKIIVPTAKGASLFQREAGKGGELHRHLQMMIKEQAEAFGWKAIIEEKIPKSLETVDVGLKRDDVWVAIEICATTGADQELQNFRKCLDAGYDYVFSVCDDEKKLSSIKAEVRKNFTFKDRERIRLTSSGDVKNLLQSIASTVIVSEKPVVSDKIWKQKLLSVTEAADFLGIKKSTLYEWIIQKKVPYYKVGRLVKFKREDLETWLKENGQQVKKSFN